MNILWVVLVFYFTMGIVAIIALDMLTGRVKQRLKSASYDTRDKLMVSGSYVGVKTALVLTLLALWIFWPVAIYGALSNLGGKNGQKE